MKILAKYTPDLALKRVSDLSKQASIPDATKAAINSFGAGLPTMNAKIPENGHNSPTPSVVAKKLKMAFCLSSSKCTLVADNMQSSRLRSAFEQRTQNTRSTKTLNSLIHYRGWQARDRFLQRLETRIVLTLAWSAGVSESKLRDLKDALDKKSTPEQRQTLIDELNRPGVNVDTLTDKFLTNQAINPDTKRFKKNFTRHDKPSEFLASKFVENHAEYLGIHKYNTKAIEREADKMLAVAAYCSSGYRDVNDALRKDDVGTNTKSFIDTLNVALSRLPDYEGIVFRGGGTLKEADVAHYQPGAVVHETAFTSTSATGGFDGDVQFVIRSKHGKDVSELSRFTKDDGVEILFPSNTPFEVISKETFGGKTFIVMQEVDDNHPSEASDIQINSAREY